MQMRPKNAVELIMSQRIKDEYSQGKPGRTTEAKYFYFDTAPNEEQSLAIVCGGYEKCARDYIIDRAGYPYSFIKFTTKGRGTLRAYGKEYKLSPGTISGFPTGCPHRYESDPANPMEHIFITFVGTKTKRFFEMSRLRDEGAVQVADYSEISDLANRILHKGLEKEEYAQQICCNYLEILMLEISRNIIRQQKQIPASFATYLKCRRFIDDSFSEIIAPGDAAEYCGINVRYMSSLFKRFGESTPGQYIMNLKLNKAANLLLTSELNVKTIAKMVGFEDPYHFSKNFKKFHGQSPSEYRKSFC